jgi:hypothetical protein
LRLGRRHNHNHNLTSRIEFVSEGRPRNLFRHLFKKSGDAVCLLPSGLRNDPSYERYKPEKHDMRGAGPRSRARGRDGNEKSTPA